MCANLRTGTVQNSTPKDFCLGCILLRFRLAQFTESAHHSPFARGRSSLRSRSGIRAMHAYVHGGVSSAYEVPMPKDSGTSPEENSARRKGADPLPQVPDELR